jgi:hypothetical protein
LLRIKILRKPTFADVDGIRLDMFVPGCSYELSNSLGALFLAEGWAEPVDTQDLASVIPVGELGAENLPAKAMREIYVSDDDLRPALAADRRRRPRRRLRH